MAAIGRNDPCPCGSGKKYKRCCALVVDVGAQAARIHELDRLVVAKLIPLFQREGFDLDFAVEELLDKLQTEHEELVQLLAPYIIYEQPAGVHFDRDDPTLGRAAPATVMLQRYAGRFDARERAWIESQTAATTRLWEVTAVERGVALELIDVESKVTRRVIERLGSSNMPLRAGVLARVVDFDGLSVFAGMYPRSIGPRGFEEFARSMKTLEKTSRERFGAKLADLGGLASTHRLIAFTMTVEVEDAARVQLPTINNTDGESFVPTTDRFTFPAARRQEVLSVLEALEHCAPDDDPEAPADGSAHYVLWKDGNRQHASWHNTIMGQIEVRASMLLLQTNSVERADHYADVLAHALDGIAKRGLRDHEDLIQAMKRHRPELPEKEPTAEELEALDEMLRAHEDAWPDSPIPALGGKTPRQAIKTKKGRAEVEMILREMEHYAPSDGQTRGMDPQRIRAALGL